MNSKLRKHSLLCCSLTSILESKAASQVTLFPSTAEAAASLRCWEARGCFWVTSWLRFLQPQHCEPSPAVFFSPSMYRQPAVCVCMCVFSFRCEPAAKGKLTLHLHLHSNVSFSLRINRDKRRGESPPSKHIGYQLREDKKHKEIQDVEILPLDLAAF